MISPFTREDTVYGILSDYSLWRGAVHDLPDLQRIIAIVGLTNNPYQHALSANGLGTKDPDVHLDRFEIGLGVHAYILQRGLQAFKENERVSRSKEKHHSEALYLYKTCTDQVCTLFQVLPPFSQTSCHSHWWTTEVFYSLTGRCRIGTRDQEQKTEPQYTALAQSELLVPPYTIHQMVNETQRFAINFLIMKRDSDHPFTDATDMEDHRYVDGPSPFTFTHDFSD